MRRKKAFFYHLKEKLDIPREALPGGFSLSLFSGGELCVCGCKRILACGEKEVRLLLGRKTLCVLGEGLFCASFSSKTVTVTGDICVLRLAEVGDED